MLMGSGQPPRTGRTHWPGQTQVGNNLYKMIRIIVDKLCPPVSWMSDTSSISGMSGISNISSRTFVSEESSLVLEVLEPDRHHYYLVPLQVKMVILS